MSTELSRRIRAARAYAEITQETMAKHLGVSIVTYKRIEAGKREVTTGEVELIAERTEMPVEFFHLPFADMADGQTNRQQLERVRGQIGDLVNRLEDIEWRMRRNVGDDTT